MVGATVTTLGVVTAAYPAAESGLGATLDGYTIQTPGSGGAWEPGRIRSDGLFVYAGKMGETPYPASSHKAPTRAATVSGLARTGADVGPAIGIGILLAALGGGLILVSRRRRRRG